VVQINIFSHKINRTLFTVLGVVDCFSFFPSLTLNIDAMDTAVNYASVLVPKFETVPSTKSTTATFPLLPQRKARRRIL
jgi:hypothetical protein